MNIMGYFMFDTLGSLWQTVVSVAWLVLAILVIIQVWGSRTTLLAKVLWTVFALLAPVCAVVVWVLVGPRKEP